MNKAEIVATFEKGDPVPEWLITVEPSEPGGLRPLLSFQQIVHVVEVGAVYHLIPDGGPGETGYILAHGPGGGSKCSLSAASKSVSMAVSWHTLGGPDDDDRRDGGDTLDVPPAPSPNPLPLPVG